MFSRRIIQLLLLTVAVSSLEGLSSASLRKPNTPSSIAKVDSRRFLQSEVPTEEPEEVEETTEESDEPEPDTTTTEADEEADEEGESEDDEGPRSSSRSGGVAAPTERECTNSK